MLWETLFNDWRRSLQYQLAEISTLTSMSVTINVFIAHFLFILLLKSHLFVFLLLSVALCVKALTSMQEKKHHVVGFEHDPDSSCVKL